MFSETIEAEDEGYFHSHQLRGPSYKISLELRYLYDKIRDIGPREILRVIKARWTQTGYHPYHSPAFEEIKQSIQSGSL